MLRARGFQNKHSTRTHASVQARLAQKVELPKEAQMELAALPGTGWRRSACHGRSTTQVAGEGAPGILLGVQGHAHTMDAEEALISAGASYTVHYLDPAQPLDTQMPEGCPLTAVQHVPVYIAGNVVLVGTEQLHKHLAAQPRSKASVHSFEKQHTERQNAQARHGISDE